MLIYSAVAIALVFGTLWICVRLSVKASPVIEKYLRRRAVRRTNINRR